MSLAALRRPGFRLPRPTVVACAVVLSAAAIAAGVLSATPGSPPATSGGTAAQSVQSFLGRYMDGNGRVVRRDQGGDSVSEGQAYAMLMTAATGDRSRFALAWGWTRANLMEPDGLLAWHWAAGRVVGASPASDADVGAAAALAVAGTRFSDPALTAAGRSLADAVIAREVVTSADGPTLVAGPWARAPVPYVDPSYLAPAEFSILERAYGGPWGAIAAAADRELLTLTGGGKLPPDWAVIGSDGRIHPTAPPSAPGAPVVFGFDAMRVPIWMATSCAAPVRTSAARLLPALQLGRGDLDLDLGGNPDHGVASPLSWLPLAAAQLAAGQSGPAQASLVQAGREIQAQPSYYGAAWLAMTRVLAGRLLGSCV